MFIVDAVFVKWNCWSRDISPNRQGTQPCVGEYGRAEEFSVNWLSRLCGLICLSTSGGWTTCVAGRPTHTLHRSDERVPRHKCTLQCARTFRLSCLRVCICSSKCQQLQLGDLSWSPSIGDQVQRVWSGSGLCDQSHSIESQQSLMWSHQCWTRQNAVLLVGCLVHWSVLYTYSKN